MRLHTFGSIFVCVANMIFSASVHAADEIYQLEADYFLRGSPQFSHSDNNKVGILMKGSAFKVIGKKMMADGSEALQIWPVKNTKFSNTNPSKQYWIYKGNKKHFKLLNHAQKTEAMALIPGEELIECADCEKARKSDHNVENISKISRKITEDANVVNLPTEVKKVSSSSEIADDTNRKNEISPPPPAEYNKRVKIDAGSFEVDGGSVEGGDLALAANEHAVQHFDGKKKNEDPSLNLEEKVAQYSESTEVEKMIKVAKKNARKKSNRDCYKFVKKALLKGELVDHYLPGATTRNSENTLKENGFINLLDREPYKSEILKPQQAPKGAILIYEGGSACLGGTVPFCGHIEIKAGEGDEPGYIYDINSDIPRVDTELGHRYKLKAVMVKI